MRRGRVRDALLGSRFFLESVRASGKRSLIFRNPVKRKPKRYLKLLVDPKTHGVIHSTSPEMTRNHLAAGFRLANSLEGRQMQSFIAEIKKPVPRQPKRIGIGERIKRFFRT